MYAWSHAPFKGISDSRSLPGGGVSTHGEDFRGRVLKEEYLGNGTQRLSTKGVGEYSGVSTWRVSAPRSEYPRMGTHEAST